jgi:hypothetical protein
MAMEISADFEKFEIQGVVFLAASRLYMQYVERLLKTYNEGDRIAIPLKGVLKRVPLGYFYDAIISDRCPSLLSPG